MGVRGYVESLWEQDKRTGQERGMKRSILKEIEKNRAVTDKVGHSGFESETHRERKTC